LHGKRAKKGVFITTGSFSAEAVAYVDHIDPKIVLIDGRRLAELMIDFDVGVNTVATYHLKRVDSDYFGWGLTISANVRAWVVKNQLLDAIRRNVGSRVYALV